MSTEATNVAILKKAYRRWHDSKGASIDHGMNLMTDDVRYPVSKQKTGKVATSLTADTAGLYPKLEQ